MFKKISENYLVIISLLLYVSSLFFVATTGSGLKPGDTWTGWAYLLFGWMGILGLVIAWYANPLYIFSVVLLLLKKYKEAFILLVISIIISLQTIYFFFMKEIPTGVPVYGLNRMVPNIGFYLWELSFIILCAHALKKFLTETNSTLQFFLSSILTSFFSFLDRNKNWLILIAVLVTIWAFLFGGEFPWYFIE